MPSSKRKILTPARRGRSRTVDVAIDRALLTALRNECRVEPVAAVRQPAQNTLYIEMTIRAWLRQRERAEYLIVD